MDFLDTNTWSASQTLAIFTVTGCLSWLLVQLIAPTVEHTAHSFTHEDLRHDRTKRKLQRLEAALLAVRNSRTPNAELRPDWQILALDGSDFEFEFMLVTTVWADAGERYYLDRLKRSSYRFQIEKLIAQTRKKIEFA